AATCCGDIEDRGKRALLVGGTGLYLKALLRGLFAGPPADLDLRRRLTEEAARAGNEALHGRLASVDPTAALRLHVNDLRRRIRVLEIWGWTGGPASAWQEQWKVAIDVPAGAPRVLWLDVPRPELYARIDARVDRMLAAGLVDEVRGLRELPRPVSRE